MPPHSLEFSTKFKGPWWLHWSRSQHWFNSYAQNEVALAFDWFVFVAITLLLARKPSTVLSNYCSQTLHSAFAAHKCCFHCWLPMKITCELDIGQKIHFHFNVRKLELFHTRNCAAECRWSKSHSWWEQTDLFLFLFLLFFRDVLFTHAHEFVRHTNI